MAKMKAPNGSTFVGWQGQGFVVNKQGWVTVPDEAVIDLIQIGYSLPDSISVDTGTNPMNDSATSASV